MSRGRPRAWLAHELAFWREVMYLRALVTTRRRDAWEVISDGIGMGSAATLRQALTRFRSRLDPVTRATLDSIGDLHLVLDSSCAQLSDTQIAERLDKHIDDNLLLLRERRRHLLSFDEHGRARIL